jgi:hypothetical protein
MRFYFTLAASEKGAMEAADQYGRQLLFGCETLMAPPAPASRAKKTIENEATEARHQGPIVPRPAGNAGDNQDKG